MPISMVFDRLNDDDFQKILSKRIRQFSWHERSEKLRSGMTRHQEWMLGLGMRWNFPDGSKGRMYYDPTNTRWERDLEHHQIRGNPILVPEILHLKTLTLGHLP